MAYQVTNLATLRLRVRERIFNTFWTDAELNAYIKEALRVWNTLTGYNKQIQNVNLVSSNGSYPISDFGTNTLAIQRIEVNNTTRLSRLTFKELDLLNPTWYTRTAVVGGRARPLQATPVVRPVIGTGRVRPLPYAGTAVAGGTATNFVSAGLSHVVLYPLTNTLTATAYVYTLAPVPASDADFIQLGEEDLAAIIDYVVFISHLKEGGIELRNSIKLLQSFLEQAGRYNAKILRSSLYKKITGLPDQEPTRPKELTAPKPR